MRDSRTAFRKTYRIFLFVENESEIEKLIRRSRYGSIYEASKVVLYYTNDNTIFKNTSILLLKLR